MKLVIVILSCFATYVKTDILLCSEYLISGSHEVEDEALTASSVHDHPIDCGPRNGRLFYPGDDSLPRIRLGGWMSNVSDTDQFIQVTFPVDTIVTAVTIQGRYKDHNQWVKSYYVLYSMDEVTWTTVTSQNGFPRLFNGNTDMNTPVTSSVIPNIPVRHLRINPRNWEWYPTMRFDVSGCQIKQRIGGLREYELMNVTLSEKMGNHTVFSRMSSRSVVDCATMCHGHSTCMAFAYEALNGVPKCTGYDAWIVVHESNTPSMDVFVNKGRGSQFKRKFAVPSWYMGTQAVADPLTTSLSFVDCAKACHKQNTCMSFALQNSDGGQICTGYSAWVIEYDNVTPSMQVFVKQDILDTYGYKEDQEAAILYNIVDVRQDQGSAAKACTSMYTRLMVVDMLAKMEGLNRIIARYYVLTQDFRYFVAGTYTSTVWSYTGDTGDVIDSDLWSPGNPDQGQGHCVMLTETGLASVDCQEQLFAICGN